MELFVLTSGMIEVNSYFLINTQTRKVVLIDGGEDYDLIKSTEKQLNVEITDLLLTHGHYDHVGNACRLQKDGVKVYISKQDEAKLYTADNLSYDFDNFETLHADYMLEDGQVLVLNDIEIKVMLTPGHTSGSCCFIVGDNIFSGDTLFQESFGRTDMKDGNMLLMMKSIKKLINLQGDFVVYSGHGEKTTLSHEREFNPIARYVKD